MARILYGVAGEGMGHAVRSAVVIQHLQKKHEILAVAGNRAYEYLQPRVKHCRKIASMNLAYSDGSVSTFRTFLLNIARTPSYVHTLRKLRGLIAKFKPDIIITDFEPFTSWLALCRSIPLIAVDNIQLCRLAKIRMPFRYWFQRAKTALVARLIVPNAQKFIITSFTEMPLTRNNAVLCPPILRGSICALKPAKGRNIMVYQTSPNRKLLPILAQINHHFLVYGFPDRGTQGNMTFKAFNEDEFYQDLASAKAVITNGGFTLVTEALALQKPILSIPIKKQFEQALTALELERTGLGAMLEKPNVQGIKRFLASLPQCTYTYPGVKQCFEAIDKAIDSIKV
ncbi:hypothetical protein HY642_06215 [Candidatus Woesearchaeota archaeon]|nr:hypothetical protein [Candidatus Woesearchaeota archaeon]